MWPKCFFVLNVFVILTIYIWNITLLCRWILWLLGCNNTFAVSVDLEGFWAGNVQVQCGNTLCRHELYLIWYYIVIYCIRVKGFINKWVCGNCLRCAGRELFNLLSHSYISSWRWFVMFVSVKTLSHLGHGYPKKCWSVATGLVLGSWRCFTVHAERFICTVSHASLVLDNWGCRTYI